jgi:hypothetical protein
MAQKTNLNISPYYDNFDPNDNYYKVLFNPGRPIQSRELTTLQSILQNQIESFGSHIFKEGSMVIPGNIAYDGQFYAVKLNPTNYGTDISVYIDYFIKKTVRGQISGTTASIQYVVLPDGTNVEDLTIYVKYKESDDNFTFNQFEDGESLIADENITYGNTTINAGTPFASLVSTNATSIGSAASIGRGVYFIRGSFVNVDFQTIILDYYTNTPSYRVGLKIDELIVTAKDDPTLYDNAKGFTNYAAPGADRFKIKLTLTKKPITDLNDTDFVELLRIKDGKIKKIESKSQYSIIKDYLAERTYDESGDYAIQPFVPSVHNSLNDRLGNNGLFFEDEKTEQGNTPSDNLMCVKVSPGKCYVRGYDVLKTGTSIIDVEKPRDTETIDASNIPFEMGNNLKVNNVSGVPRQKYTILLKDRRVGDSGSTIGDARVYAFELTDAAYTNNATNWDLYLYDIQTYTTLTLNSSVSNTELPATSFVKGKSSGASGYAVSAGGDSTTISLRQTSGTFLVGEQILINGLEFPRTIKSLRVYNTQNIKSVYQSTSGYPTFSADTKLENFYFPNGITNVSIASDGTVTSSKPFTGINIGTIIKYRKSAGSVETFNRVTAVNGTTLTVAALGAAVSNVCDNTLPGTTVTPTNVFLGAPIIGGPGKLYAQLPDDNVSSVNLSNSLLSLNEQITSETTNSSGVMTFNISQITGITSAFFQSFDEERYSIHYSDGVVENLTSDKFSLSNNIVTISNLRTNQSDIVVNVSLVKNGIQSKVKTYNKSATINVSLSKYAQSGTTNGSSLNDGLTYNQYYGLRVQDEEICLKYPDVSKIIAVYESFDSSSPVLDTIQFSASANVTTNAIIGENIVGKSSKAVARVVTKPSTNILGIVYLNENSFTEGESVLFQESNITTSIESITVGKYKNITNSYTLDKGQKDQYYDYSKLVRRTGIAEPAKQLLVVFDYYSVPSNDSGDVFTVLSYDQQRFQNDIPNIGPGSVRASDTLDFRPRVSVFTSTSASPFDFSQRSFDSDPKVILSPNESSLIGYTYYLGRIDKLYIDKFGSLIVEKGVSSRSPKEPRKNLEVMNIATIRLSPYLYTPQEALISLDENRRYTMRDIGAIEDRVENLERVTSLSLLELNTQTLQIQDAQGNDRFKSGFFVDDFKSFDLINRRLSKIQVNPELKELSPIVSRNSLKSQIAPASQLIDEQLDLSINFDLLDPNVQKTGNLITLKYNSVGWIEQPFATRVENVNPFNVIVYTGEIKLTPSEDRWIRTVQLPDRTIERSVTVNLNIGEIRGQDTNESRSVSIGGGWGRFVDTTVESTTRSNEIRNASVNSDTTSQRLFVGSFREAFMRSRNTEFSVTMLKPGTQYYQFLDGNSSVDFVPKLIEIANDPSLQNYGASNAFQVGETVVGTFNGANLISFRVASGNHKYGPFSAPTTTYQINPYIKTEKLSASYSSSSKVLNIDTFSLSEEAQGRYSGYLVKGMVLVGQTSGAVAYVKDLRLISDNYGDIIGTFFLRDPNASPTPTVRIQTGNKTYKITSSSTNKDPLPGSTSVSTAETSYSSEGTVEQFENVITTTNTTTNTLITQTSTDTVTTARYVDPLAQSFVVGGNIEAPSPTNTNDDVNGAFLTAVDLFFAAKPTGNNPVRIEIRNMQLGTPTREIIGKPVTLRPDDVKTSDTAEIATHVVFESPIYLSPGREYAIVIISDTSDDYELWTAQMGEKTVNTASLPDASSVRYTTQFSMGSLFKSQNGSIWTANQYQDLKFKLYKAEFTSQSGTSYFYNPTLDSSNGYIKNLDNNALTTFPKTATIGITTVSNSTLTSILSLGRKIGESTKTYNYGYVVGVGCSVGTVGLTTGGKNYVTDSSVDTFNITGKGSGLVLNISATNGVITGTPTIVSRGHGYAVGDVVGIVTSTAGNTGTDARITITGNGNCIDTLYLSGVQAESFTGDGSAQLVYYNGGTRVSLGSTLITSYSSDTNQNSGNFIRVSHFDHGMYSKVNKLTISDVEPNYPPVAISAPLIAESTTISVAIADTANFGTFEGIPVSATNPGYVKIENEIIKYESVGNGLLNTISRSQDSTISIVHPIGTLMYKYELNGVSLRRINTNHDISDLDITLDEYYLEIDRSSTKGTDRSADASLANAPQLSFTDRNTLGGPNIHATQNIQYNALIPNYNILTPGSLTSVSAAIRSTSGTSVSGDEVSFLDNGFEPVELNKLNTFNSTRIVCSKINETEYLSGVPRNKSFTTAITLNTNDKNLSPAIFCDSAHTEFNSNRLDRPIIDYISDSRVNSGLYDPHSSIYVSNTITLQQPATSLKVILSAYRPASSDFRVLYSLIRPDSSEVTQAFELFPGYNNLTLDNNGKYSVIDSGKNTGEPDAYVNPNLTYGFSEYQFTADNLDLFTGYTIKIVMSGTNQAYAPKIKEFRTIAVR